MLSISFTTEHSCVSSLTFMVLGSPSCETQVTGKIPEPHDGGGEGGYFSDTLEYFKAQFVLNFWNTFGGRTSTQYIKVSSEALENIRKNINRNILPFLPRTTRVISFQMKVFHVNDGNLSSLHLSFSITIARALHFIQS